MTVGIVGLGLIGGLMAKAYKAAEHTVYGFDSNTSITDFAKLAGVIDEPLTDERISACELILIAVYPVSVVAWLREHAAFISSSTIVIDCAGTKRVVCEACFPIASEHGFTFVGGHPMAGTHKNGLKNSRDNLFSGAPMVIVPPVYDDIELYARVKELLLPARFGKISVTTAQEHDSMIAFPSQLAHVVSNAYIKSPEAMRHKGFSAGSYKDLTRVAWLDPDMWTELFFENRDNLLRELNGLIAALQEYQQALSTDDHAKMHALLEEGRNRKEEVDGR